MAESELAESELASSDPPSVFVRERDAWSQISRLGQARYRLRLGGLFQTSWLAALCSQLAEHHLSIDCTHAKLSRDQSWVAEMQIVALPGAPDPMPLSFLGLTAATERPVAGAVQLASFQCSTASAYGGCIMLTLEAPDSLGLLGALLGLLAEVSLYPLEMHIDTRLGRAHDCLWLACEGGRPPSPEVLGLLEAKLATMVSTTPPLTA